MRSAIVVVGVIVALAGLLFALQGFGAVSGSPMTKTTTWSILGPIIALIGIAIAFAGWRGRKSLGHKQSYVERAPVANCSRGRRVVAAIAAYCPQYSGLDKL